jgi:hypothetical protein
MAKIYDLGLARLALRPPGPTEDGFSCPMPSACRRGCFQVGSAVECSGDCHRDRAAHHPLELEGHDPGDEH